MITEQYLTLTGYTVACKIKKHYTSSTSTTVTAAILSPATAGQIQLSLTNGQTTAMKSGRYVYDVVITSTSGIKVQSFGRFCQRT